ncbi:unnamed protein product [Cylicostephanus goldi]|uniref:Uncharacterized protein n=1 Tax=Cylicostephanus goldi TaxID=71465 RepID=A0A3P7MXP2_CYLGO|nr:unnamed protein product [Cylicostephanus goldi]
MSTPTLPLVESDKLEDSRAVGSFSPLTISPAVATPPQEEARLSEVGANAGKRLIRKTDQEEIDEIMDAFRRNYVAWMNRKLEDLKQQVLSKVSTPISQEQEQEDENSGSIYANPDCEWMDEFEQNPPPQTKTLRLIEPKWSELAFEEEDCKRKESKEREIFQA